MSALILLDTSVIITYPKIRMPQGDLLFSAISYAELSFGVSGTSDVRVRADRQSRLSIFDRMGIEWIPFDRQAAVGYAELAARVKERRPRHARSKDIMLAGQAYALGAALATTNPKDFELVADRIEIITPDYEPGTMSAF